MANVKPTDDIGAETQGLALGAVVLPVALPEAEQAVREALGSEGFGVLSEVDVSATLKAKLGVERTPLKILGACKPSLADRALQLEPDAAMILPCNVVLSGERLGQTTVRVADPRKVLPPGRLSAIAEEAADMLGAVLRKLS
jgi:uncharacterized protein (DUF302 family)